MAKVTRTARICSNTPKTSKHPKSFTFGQANLHGQKFADEAGRYLLLVMPRKLDVSVPILGSKLSMGT